MRQFLALFLLWVAIFHLSSATSEDRTNRDNGMSFKEDSKSLEVKGLDKLQGITLSKKPKMRNKKDKAKKKKWISRKNKRNHVRRNKGRNFHQRKKKMKKSKKKTNRRKSGKRKKRKGNKARKTETKQQTCVAGCSDLMVIMMKLQRKQTTFLKQFNRIVRCQTQAKKKGLKKDNFDSNTTDGPLNVLISAGGGNKSELVCAGSKTNKAAIMMKNLTEKLEKCQSSIASKCNLTAAFVKIKQEWKDCNASMISFKAALDGCLKKKGKEAGDCFVTTEMQALITKVNACNSSEMAAASEKDVKARKYCMSEYGACRASGEMIRKVLHICAGPTEKELKEKVGKIFKNKQANEAIVAKTKALVTGVRHMKKRSISGTTITINGMTFDLSICPIWGQAAILWLGALEKDVTEDISGLGLLIANITPTCTAADKAKLMAVQAKGEAVAKKVQKKWDMVQNILNKATGSTISPEAAASLVDGTTVAATSLVDGTTVAATVTKSVRRRRRIMEHVMLHRTRN